jgi:hypothetical protein
MKTSHKNLLKWLAENTQIREALADAIRDNSMDDILNIIDPEPQGESRLDATGCKNIGDLLMRNGPDGPALEIFRQCIDRTGWHGREDEVVKMRLSSETYTPGELFREITLRQNRVEKLPG